MMAAWCFVCERDGVVLEEFRQRDGRLATACADQKSCRDAYALRFARKHRPRKATR